MKDFINESYIWVDQLPAAGSSDAVSSDVSVSNGAGVRFDGWRYATLIGLAGAPSGTSDGVALVRLEYSTLNVSSDYASFSTDAVSASLAYATSDVVANSIEGVGIVDVDLWAAGLTTGFVRSQIVLNGTNVAPTAAVIILSRRNGGIPAQVAAVVRV